MKKMLLALCLLACHCQVPAQTTTPYYTGFDDATQQAGWQTFKKGNTVKPVDFTMTTYAGAPSAPNAASHEYPLGGANPAIEDWLVSPMFNFAGGGIIDTIKVNVFKLLGIKVGDEFSIYLLNGSPDPALATTTLIVNLTNMANGPGGFRDTFKFAIPPTMGNSYIGFKYMATNNWFSAHFDDLKIDAFPYCAPTGAATITPQLTSATINWPALPGVTGYEYVIDNNAANPTTGTFTANTTLNPIGLSSSTMYYLHLRAVCSATSLSAWNTQSFTTLTPPDPCPQPDAIILSNITSNSVKMDWAAISNAKGFEYTVKEDPAMPSVSGATALVNFANINNLKPGTTYHAFLRTRCDGLTGFIFSPWISKEFFTHFPSSINMQDGGAILHAYPNPVNDILTLQGTTANSQIIITDMSGRRIQTPTATIGTTFVNMSSYPAGIYLLQYTSGTHTTHLKINKR